MLNRKKRIKRNKDSLRDLWDNTKHTNIHIIGSQKKREKGAENICEDKIAEKFRNLGKETDIQVQETESLKYD